MPAVTVEIAKTLLLNNLLYIELFNRCSYLPSIFSTANKKDAKAIIEVVYGSRIRAAPTPIAKPTDTPVFPLTLIVKDSAMIPSIAKNRIDPICDDVRTSLMPIIRIDRPTPIINPVYSFNLKDISFIFISPLYNFRSAFAVYFQLKFAPPAKINDNKLINNTINLFFMDIAPFLCIGSGAPLIYTGYIASLCKNR
nr:hypothetical protein [Thermotalea metallivorans]